MLFILNSLLALRPVDVDGTIRREVDPHDRFATNDRAPVCQLRQSGHPSIRPRLRGQSRRRPRVPGVFHLPGDEDVRLHSRGRSVIRRPVRRYQVSGVTGVPPLLGFSRRRSDRSATLVAYERAIAGFERSPRRSGDDRRRFLVEFVGASLRSRLGGHPDQRLRPARAEEKPAVVGLDPHPV